MKGELKTEVTFATTIPSILTKESETLTKLLISWFYKRILFMVRVDLNSTLNTLGLLFRIRYP